MRTRKVKYLVLWGFIFYALIVFLPTFNASPIFHLYYMIMMDGLAVAFMLIATLYLRKWVRTVVLIFAIGGFLHLLFLLNLNSPLQYMLRLVGVSMGAVGAAYAAKYLLDNVNLNVLDYVIYGSVLTISILTQELLIIVEALAVLIMVFVAKSCRKTWLIKGIWWFVIPYSAALLANTLYYFGLIGAEALLKILASVTLAYASIAVYFLFTSIELFSGIKKAKRVIEDP